MKNENQGGDNVIQAFSKPELPTQTITVAAQPPGKKMFCQHARLSIDAHERLISCADCGQVLDPFQFLHQNAMTLQRAWQDHAYVKQELGEMQDRVSSLKKEEQRLRAMVKRLSEKTGTFDVRGKGVL
jgi:hypothetical protein